MKKILLAGFGNIGYRYVEGLLLISELDFELTIIEPNNLVFQNNLVRLTKQGLMKDQKFTHRTLEELSGTFNLAIVSTNSKDRAFVISQIRNNTNVQNWVLEKVLARSESELDQIARTIDHDNAWVNTPRRLTSIYKLLKNKFCKGKITLTVRMKTFTIGCNAIHFIDTVCWLVDANLKKVEIAASSDWYEAKREGFKEFNGSLRAIYDEGSILIIDNTCENKDEGIWLETEGKTYHLDEAKGIQDGGEFFASRMEYQSELTADLVRNILIFGQSELPTLSESIKQHRLFFSGLIDCDELKKFGDGLIPIT